MKRNRNMLHMWGGLGNQLFLYGLYKHFQKKGIDISISNYYFSSPEWNGMPYELDKLGIHLTEKPLPFLVNCYLKSNSFIGKVLRHSFLHNFIFNEHAEMTFDSNVLTLRGRYIIGYFQSEKYFEDVAEDIKAEIKFQDCDLPVEREMANEMQACNSVAIHVRLGDYLKFANIYGNCATPNYYKDAIEYIKKKVNNPVFYLFSNDIPEAKKLFNDEKIIPVDINQGDKSYMDMYLMSQCKHCIVANSSFSWWGAWLNSNPTKIVVAPKKWVNTSPSPDIWAKGWIKI